MRVWLATIILAAGCSGSIQDAGGSGPAPSGPGADPAQPDPTQPSRPSLTPPPGDPLAAGPLPLRRLTIREYNATVHDLLGDSTAPASKFASDRDETFLFPRAGAVA